MTTSKFTTTHGLHSKVILLVVIMVLLFVRVESSRYRAHDRIGLVANTVGPFNNPTETYPVYYTINSISHIYANTIPR
jgi:hypothetical protein